MRIPLAGNISTKDGATNKNSRLYNVLAETRKDGKVVAGVRPGLNTLATGSGNGNSIVCFNDTLINIYGTSISKAVDTVSSSTGGFTPPVGSWTYYSAYDIAGNGNIFCIAPYANATVSHFFTSTDGITWTQRSNSAGAFASSHYQIIWDGYQFVAVTPSLDSYIVSGDGITWNRYSITGAPIGSLSSFFNYCNGLYCFSYLTTSAVTSNFSTWSYGTTPYQIFAIGASYTAFIGVVYNSNKALRSTNGTSWATTDLPVTANWVSVAFNGDTICIVANNSTTCAVSTDDGATWVSGTLPSTGYVSINGSGGKFVAAKNGAVSTSQDGLTWVEAAASFAKNPTYRGASNGSKFCFGEYSFSTTTPSTLVVDYGVTLQAIGTVGNDKHDFALIP